MIKTLNDRICLTVLYIHSCLIFRVLKLQTAGLFINFETCYRFHLWGRWTIFRGFRGSCWLSEPGLPRPEQWPAHESMICPPVMVSSPQDARLSCPPPGRPPLGRLPELSAPGPPTPGLSAWAVRLICSVQDIHHLGSFETELLF